MSGKHITRLVSIGAAVLFTALFIVFPSKTLASASFTKYANNPVFTPSGEFENHSMIKVGSTYYMYWTGLDCSGNTVYCIEYATSSNLTSWTNGSVVLSPSVSGWDSGGIWTPSVIVVSGTYYMFYTGWNSSQGSIFSSNSHWDVGYATASSPTGPWTKYSANPVITPGTWDQQAIIDSTALYLNGTFYVFYTGNESGFGSNDNIGLATSTNATTWTEDASNPVLPVDDEAPSVQYNNGTFYLLAKPLQENDAALDFYSSSNGYTWSSSPLNPILTPSQSWEGSWTWQGNLLIDGSTAYIFYNGHGDDDGGGSNNPATLMGMASTTVSNLPLFFNSSTSTLRGYWKFDEGSGTTALDSSGFGNNGTIQSGATYSTTKPSTSFSDPYSLQFNGSTGYVSGIPNTVGDSLPFSVSLWFYPTTQVVTSYPVMVSNDAHGGTGQGWLMGFKGSTSQFGISVKGTSLFYDPSSVSLNAWHHGAVTVDAFGDVTVYVDGTSVATSTYNNFRLTGTTFLIGADSGGGGSSTTTGFFTGMLDDLRVYNYVLSPTQVSALASGNETADTWTGSTNANYETGSNWNTGYTPDPYTNVVIATSTNEPVLGANEQMANLTINSASTLDLAGYHITQNASGAFTNEGTLDLQGGEALTNFTNDTTDSGTVLYYGTSSYGGLAAGNSYANLTFNGSGGTWTLNNALTVKNNLTISAGSLDSSTSSYGITVGGAWSNAGSFTPRSGTVTLNGIGQSFSGATIFYNL